MAGGERLSRADSDRRCLAPLVFAMSRRRRKRLPTAPVQCTIDALSHDGRGIAHIDGKTVFIDGALPGEEVVFSYISTRRGFDEGRVTEVLRPAPQRVEPRCAHFGVCGGCSLQHMDGAAQVMSKQAILLEQLQHIGRVSDFALLPPLRGEAWGYRRKARLGVRYVRKKGRVLVGFRERHAAYLADIERCEVLDPRVGLRIADLKALVGEMRAFDHIPQIEVAAGDRAVALVFRNLEPLGAADQARLTEFADACGVQIFLQPGGPETVTPLREGEDELAYALPAHDVELVFLPTDFTQVNASVNRAMVDQALTLLAPQAADRVLDLFCGIGNFSLPLARRAAHVIGLEGDPGLVARAGANARRNNIANADFHAADLEQGLPPGVQVGDIDQVLLDPPRSGARVMVEGMARLAPRRIVYVSCNTATLARDTEVLVHQHGYRLVSAGIMDMFPHTAHAEAMALFERAGGRG